jgi:KUP system potassium uptake protein
MITPAISVLSAVEGLNVASRTFAPYTMPIAAAILLLLFVAQRFGTAALGQMFGPIMVLWFATIATLGAAEVFKQPEVLTALNPGYAFSFLFQHRVGAWAILGAAFLAVTGAEAMYADMGHMGRKPIQFAWFALVLPALVLNYAGQTGTLFHSPRLNGNPFFLLVPDWGLYPLVALATVATIIASQAIITGSFSLTRQAMQLGWLPGMHIDQTSSEEYGQIYVPFVNWSMMIATLALTFFFASSERLAGAYGTAVSTTMLLTTALLYRVMRISWRLPIPFSLCVFLGFFIVDLSFFSANLMKIGEGGWVPLIVGAAIFIVMTTWRTGVDAVHRRQNEERIDIEDFLRTLRDDKIARVPGKALFLTRLQNSIPPVIAEHIRQFGSLHRDVVALTVLFTQSPRIIGAKRLRVQHIGKSFWHLTIRVGFVEIPDIPKLLHKAKDRCPIDLDDALYIVEHDCVVGRKTRPRMAVWRRHLFSFLFNNSAHSADRFNLPASQFVQIGRQREV